MKNLVIVCKRLTSKDYYIANSVEIKCIVRKKEYVKEYEFRSGDSNCVKTPHITKIGGCYSRHGYGLISLGCKEQEDTKICKVVRGITL